MTQQDRQQFWNKKHIKYTSQDWIELPTIFATQVVGRFPPNSKILDIGSGQGQDTIYFAKQGYQVTALDFSSYALEQLKSKLVREGITLATIQHDISDTLPFSNEDFDIVYSHLALHYFDQTQTKQIFCELARIIKKKGLLCVLVNSKDDPEFGTGTQIEEGYFMADDGDFKRYFSRTEIYENIKDLFIPYILDDKGYTTHKDQTENFVALVANRL